MGGGHAVAFAVHFCRREIAVSVFFSSLLFDFLAPRSKLFLFTFQGEGVENEMADMH